VRQIMNIVNEVARGLPPGDPFGRRHARRLGEGQRTRTR
jgi:hypothetical protein